MGADRAVSSQTTRRLRYDLVATSYALAVALERECADVVLLASGRATATAPCCGPRSRTISGVRWSPRSQS